MVYASTTVVISNAVLGFANKHIIYLKLKY